MSEAVRAALEDAAGRCKAESIALSGGLDSTVLAWLLREKRPAAFAVILPEYEASDLAYCQIAADHCGLDLSMVSAGAAQALDAAESAIAVLGRFGDIEVRNAAVMHMAIKAAKEAGHAFMVTGDGADELFAGYSFMREMDPAQLGADLARIRQQMRFSSQELGCALGVRIESPFLDAGVQEAARAIPAELMTGKRGVFTYGKMPVRMAFEKSLPHSIAWRAKAAMQDGAGTAGLSGMFESVMPDQAYEEKRGAILERDGVRIRSKESLYYYERYRERHPAPEKSEGGCAYCGHKVAHEKRYCRMCGAYPA